MELVGRYNEKYALQQYVESDKAEFIAVHTYHDGDNVWCEAKRILGQYSIGSDDG